MSDYVQEAPAEHLTNCDVSSCPTCDNLIEFYMACDQCGHWGHKDSSGWADHPIVLCSPECVKVWEGGGA